MPALAQLNQLGLRPLSDDISHSRRFSSPGGAHTENLHDRITNLVVQRVSEVLPGCVVTAVRLELTPHQGPIPAQLIHLCIRESAGEIQLCLEPNAGGQISEGEVLQRRPPIAPTAAQGSSLSSEVAKRSAPPLIAWRLKRVTEYIERNLSEQITLADLAAAAGMSPMYFAGRFRAATGIRPHQYLLQKRIERAQDMLLRTSESLVEIALTVGFQTQAHFTTTFKKLVGDTPHQWRCQHKPTLNDLRKI